MQVLEAPIHPKWPLHGPKSDKFGQFVLISLDAVAAVAPLDDPEATRAAAALPRTKYLAMAYTSGKVLSEHPDGYLKLNLLFYMVGVGLPRLYPYAAIPISPTEYHPNGRAPVALSEPLPWPNLYFHTFYDYAAIVSRIHIGPNQCQSRLFQAGRRELYKPRTQDMDALAAEKEAEKREHHPEACSSSPSAEVMLPGGSVHYTESGDYSSSSESPEVVRPVDEETEAVQKKLNKVLPHVEVWMDISVCDDPATLGLPEDFFWSNGRSQEVHWENRVMMEIMAKRPHTTAWLQGVMTPPADEDPLRSGRASLTDGDRDEALQQYGAVDSFSRSSLGNVTPRSLSSSISASSLRPVVRDARARSAPPDDSVVNVHPPNNAVPGSSSAPVNTPMSTMAPDASAGEGNNPGNAEESKAGPASHTHLPPPPKAKAIRLLQALFSRVRHITRKKVAPKA
ncbi:hypothetical protein EXIGLDRAFT_719532 [Exidia glandulosa HHB12029]|uniref:Uncharacterized protein n=1 Tax=Exidia glandulosa HHB12029 TaxID=1314781 RepID=A0A165H009_EXIGL|nr:hypothetical protein EXIGLDRAFT_719532 [Exidia glandulosa HHB12029]